MHSLRPLLHLSALKDFGRARGTSISEQSSAQMSETLSDPGDIAQKFLATENVIIRTLKAFNEGPTSPASSRRLSGSLPARGAAATAERLVRWRAWLPGGAHRSVRKRAADMMQDWALRAALLLTRRGARLVPAPHAPVRCAASG